MHLAQGGPAPEFKQKFSSSVTDCFCFWRPTCPNWLVNEISVEKDSGVMNTIEDQWSDRPLWSSFGGPRKGKVHGVLFLFVLGGTYVFSPPKEIRQLRSF